jgi:hypothetical protein
MSTITSAVQITDLNSFVAMQNDAAEHFGLDPHGQNVWFRGQPKADLPLKPRLFRQGELRSPRTMHGTTDSVKGREASLCYEFMLGAGSRTPKCPPWDDFASWLLMMQHFGLSTRVLDWSSSPMVATYFAVGFGPDDVPAEVVVLAPGLLNKAQDRGFTVHMPMHPEAQKFAQRAVSRGKWSDEVHAWAGNHFDVRFLMQQANFTVHDGLKSLEELPKADRFVRRYTVPTGARRRLRNDLHMVGVSFSTLFPTLDHLSSELNARLSPEFQEGR